MGHNVAVIIQNKNFHSLSVILLKSPISLASFSIDKTFLSNNRSAIDSGFRSSLFLTNGGISACYTIINS